MPLLFIGERRSALAIRRNWTWADARLASATLQAALAPLQLRYGIEYDVRNLWRDDRSLDPLTLTLVRLGLRAGWAIVALGARVHTALAAHGYAVPCMVHPAARGSIRGRESYQAHVRLILTPLLDRSTP